MSSPVKCPPTLPFDPASYHHHPGLIATATNSDPTVSTTLHIRLATEHYTSQLATLHILRTNRTIGSKRITQLFRTSLFDSSFYSFIVLKLSFNRTTSSTLR
ncbi:hypothetical protein CROQUDRAFT_88915 [Cronartium quercuum f. sp. fusiforme G11]|uniref:Uncharacterized protein n=1 Tax=Cronartium quercuum f. sp. fusiforme G11 TaxID=708437 RepID=A0A9P6NM11_9BASI|nr:hypothetical protein CROQUDRAFT_88915 [Cronartium quercuum f. sp. fusiforme G11]